MLLPWHHMQAMLLRLGAYPHLRPACQELLGLPVEQDGKVKYVDFLTALDALVEVAAPVCPF